MNFLEFYLDEVHVDPADVFEEVGAWYEGHGSKFYPSWIRSTVLLCMVSHI